MKTLIVLAGGKSTRMGEDKVFLPFSDGRTFLEHLIEEARPYFARVIVSGGSSDHCKKVEQTLAASAKGVEQTELLVVPDRYPEKGPMGGLVSVYEAAGVRKFAVIPVDSPKADMEVLSFLYDRCTSGACLMADETGRPEPLYGAYGEAVLCRMQTMLKEGNYRIRDAFSKDLALYSTGELSKALRGKSESGILECFRNINTAEDYRNDIR